MSLSVPIIVGTARPERESHKVGKYVCAHAEKIPEISPVCIDIKDYLQECSIGEWQKSPVQKKWKNIAEKADGFIIVAPEYNHAYPGELKIFLDQIIKPYDKKPVVVCGVSSGRMGGVRVVLALHTVCIELGLVPVPYPLYFSNVDKLFDTAGAITDSSYDTRVAKTLGEFVWYANTLKAGRENNI